jgi:hypothetical protein
VTIPRFRQSLAKVLIQRSPKDLKKMLDGQEYETTDAMDKGSVLDSMVFGGAVFEQTQYKWTTKVGREQRDALKAQGIIPLRPGQVPESQGLADAVRTKIAELGIDLDDPCTFKQREILWTSDEGVECKGTPDLYTCDVTVSLTDGQQYTLVNVYDLKATNSAHPNTLEKQVYRMCWHLQAAAYREAVLHQAEADGFPKPVYGGHTIIAAESTGTDRVLAFPLSDKYIGVGKRQWEQAQETWTWCHANNEFPDYEERTLEPPTYTLSAEDIDADDLSGLGLVFGDES